MEKITAEKPISWLDGVDPKTGIIIQERHDLRGKSIKGKILEMPYSIGSTVGSYTFFKMKKHGTLPAKIVLGKPDPITQAAILAGVPVEVKGVKSQRIKYSVLTEGIPDRILSFIEAEAQVSGAEEVIPIASAHVSGASYELIGDAGLEFLEELASEGGKVRVPTTLNPVSLDLEDWRQLGFSQEYAEKQARIVSAYKRMGVNPTCTCTPYYAENCPLYGQHVSWAESSAVAYVNSVIGARTNRESGLKALASAILGGTPLYGLHLEENRKPRIKVQVEAPLRGHQYSWLGYWIGVNYGEIPLITGVKNVSRDQLKALGAGGGASGKMPLYHVEGITPEALKGIDKSRINLTVRFTLEELNDVRNKLTTTGQKPDLIAIGCPHLSLKEIEVIVQKLKGRKLECDLWLFTSRRNKIHASRTGWTTTLEEAGARLVADTCMVVSPIERLGYKITATNSAKAAHYLRTLRGQDTILGTISELMEKYSREV